MKRSKIPDTSYPGHTRGFSPDVGASYVLVLPKLAGPIHAIAFMGEFLRQERI